MTASYSKKPFCYTCNKRIDGFLEQHQSLGHKTTETYFGGYQEVEERRQALVVEPQEKEVKLDLADTEEMENDAIEEGQ